MSLCKAIKHQMKLWQKKVCEVSYLTSKPSKLHYFTVASSRKKRVYFSWNHVLGFTPGSVIYGLFSPSKRIFSIIGWQVAENDWSLWVARRLAVGIRYSDICWQAYPLTANTFKVSPTGTLLVLISIITETWHWELTFQRLGYCQFLQC